MTVQTRVKPGAAEVFRGMAEARGLTESEALREAMSEWTKARMNGRGV